jgi:hypothetical protein
MPHEKPANGGFFIAIRNIHAPSRAKMAEKAHENYV